MSACEEQHLSAQDPVKAAEAAEAIELFDRMYATYHSSPCEAADWCSLRIRRKTDEQNL